MEVGDWICLGGMGAYTYGPKSTFNGMEALNDIHLWNPSPIHEKGKVLSYRWYND